MSISRFEISLLSPFKAYKNSTSPGVHMDDDWFANQIKDWERQVRYYGKWEKTDQPRVQVISTLEPVTFRLYKCDGSYEATSAMSLTKISTDAANEVNLMDGVVNFSAVPDGIYYPVFQASFADLVFIMPCEPIHVKATHKNTSLFKYSNSLNDFGVVFSGTVDATNQPYKPEFNFRCEAAIMEYSPDRERSSYKDQVLNVTTLSATPARLFKLLIGTAPGVAPYVVDIMNRILCCDYVLSDDLQIETPEGSKWEINRIKGYPMIGASIDVVEAKNRSSLQMTSELIPAGGVVVGYDFDTDAFGTPTAPASSNPVQMESIEDS